MNTEAVCQNQTITPQQKIVIDEEILTYIKITDEFEKKMRELMGVPNLPQPEEKRIRCPQVIKPVLRKAYRIVRWFVRKTNLRSLLYKTKLYHFLESRRILEKLGR